MSIKYLEDKSWKDITREERPFCSELFSCINGNENKFIKIINEECNSSFDENCEWDSGYEVCFYRDFLKLKDKSVRESPYSQKRTFDLCLFSNKCIIIIEAKVQQGFESKQLSDFENDKADVKKLIKEYTHDDIDIKLIALTSSIYLKNLKKKKSKTLGFFDYQIDWLQLAATYKEKKEIFQRADDLYKK